MELTKTDRRTFLRRGAMGAGALWAVSLQELAARRKRGGIALAIPSPYGPISPKIDESTGLPLIMLPDGFRYQSFSWTGDVMSDGVRCPSLHDGMAVVDEIRGRFSRFIDLNRRGSAFVPQLRDNDDGRDHDDDDRDGRKRLGRLILVRNHEQASGLPYLDRPRITYRDDGAGGTSNMIFDARRGRWEADWSSLAGTVRNCAGGVSPWGTWVTCEETDVDGHGWSFDVGPLEATPDQSWTWDASRTKR